MRPLQRKRQVAQDTIDIRDKFTVLVTLRPRSDGSELLLNKAGRLTALEFISFGAHIDSVYGAADMPLIGPIPEGGTFFCPHCGALYSVTHSRLSKSDSNIAKCVVCLQIMDSWGSTKVPIYKLIHRPEDA